MATPLEEYTQALQVRNAQDRAQDDIINAYTKLADKYAELQRARRNVAPEPEEQKEERSITPSRIPPSITGSRAPSLKRVASDSPAQLRADLIGANKMIHDLNLQIASFKDEVATLKSKEATAEKKTAQLQTRITKLETERISLNRRLRDKDGELKEKGRMVSDVQDEMVGMEMQMNLAEERAKKLEKENEQLVERWMKKVGGEADEMNRGSGWK